MQAIGQFYQYAPIIVAALATAILALVAPKLLTKLIAYAAGVVLVGFAGWTLFSAIAQGGARSGYHLPFLIFTVGSGILGAMLWRWMDNVHLRMPKFGGKHGAGNGAEVLTHPNS